MAARLRREKIFDKLGLPYMHFITTDESVEKNKTEIMQDIVDRFAVIVTSKFESEADLRKKRLIHQEEKRS